MSARVLTVILNWRTPEMTLQAAETAVAAMTGVEGGIIIVDNDSGDGSEAQIRAGVAARGWDRVQVLQAGRNGGFGAGNNVGIRAGLPGGQLPDYVYLLNSDAFPAPETITRLRDHLDAHPRLGMAGGYVGGPDGVPHQTLFRFPSIASEFEGAARTGPVTRLLRRHVVPLPIPQVPVSPADWSAGCSLMLRQQMLDQIGLFDETFFLYFEETDLCRRAAGAGWGLDYLRDAPVVHIGSESTGMKRWARTPGYWFDSRWHYFRKHHGRSGAVFATLSHLAGGLLHRMRAALSGGAVGDPPHFLKDLARHMLRQGKGG
ncbi:glycosyltransferase family 2 protein [Falsigemmobacter faecalis]|uniref:Glycosyltransferase family 2 protein n=1 Tax=Falsigemmobacter faecalis TaxID=2488730 RepID=A0A3P3DUU8_9RHOB|nr:glycosyltransferase family 2 protein [Falsigemmobacter faecalis]RRH77931.1 glycosyltransferase family 2 protein [Falsigemmobacter faecalis]